jgi:hypothetical protein
MAFRTASPNSTGDSPLMPERVFDAGCTERRRQLLFLQFCRVGAADPLPVNDASEGLFIDCLRDFKDRRPELVACIARLLNTKQQKATRPDFPFLEKLMPASDLKSRWRRFLIERLGDKRIDPAHLKPMFLDYLASQASIEPASAEADAFVLERTFARVAAMPDKPSPSASSEPTFVAAPHEIVHTAHPIANYIEARDGSGDGDGHCAVIFKTSAHAVPTAMALSSPAVLALLACCKSPRTTSDLTEALANGRSIHQDRLAEAVRNALSKLLAVGLIRRRT